MKPTLVSALLVGLAMGLSGCVGQVALDKRADAETARKDAETTIMLEKAEQDLKQDEEWHQLVMHICRTGWPWLAGMLAGGLAAEWFLRIRRVEVDRLRAEAELRWAEARLIELRRQAGDCAPIYSATNGAGQGATAGAGNTATASEVDRTLHPAVPTWKAAAMARCA